jgi:hypothetical protein
MPNRVGSRADGKAKDAHGVQLWKETKAGIAAKSTPHTDINEQNRQRAKSASWTDKHQDSTSAGNSNTGQRRQN